MRKKMGDMARMAKQAKDLRSKVKKVEKELKKTLIPGTNKEETVKVVFDAKINFRSIQIDPEYLAGVDAKKLEKAISEAVTNSLQEAHRVSENKMAVLQNDVQIPGLTD